MFPGPPFDRYVPNWDQIIYKLRNKDKIMHDALGDRMKSQYEDRARYTLPRRTYTIIRLDGKAFHTYTKTCKKPFDLDLIEDFDNAAKETIEQIQGAKFGYAQSDEFSILLTDFDKITTDAWFDGNIQKMVSVAASTMTAHFNKYRARRWRKNQIELKNSAFLAWNGMGEEADDNTDLDKHFEFKLAYFDARVFTIPDPTEVYNYFVWRNNDCARNSINMVAQSIFSFNELQNQSCSQIHDMLHLKNINWAEYPDELKNGRLIVKEEREEIVVGKSGAGPIGSTPLGFVYGTDTKVSMKTVKRTEWVARPAWVFTKNPEPLKALIPKYE